MSDLLTVPGGPDSTTPGQSIDDYIRKNYGFEAWALDVPELRAILEQAIRERWTGPVGQAKMDGAIARTNWYKSHTASERQFQADYGRDKAGMDGRIAQMASEIQALAAKSGLTISPERLKLFATNAVREGWVQSQIQQALGYEFNYKGGPQIPAHMVNGQLVDNVTGKPAFYGPNGEPAQGGPGEGLTAYTMADGRVAYYKAGNTKYGDSSRPDAVLNTPGQTAGPQAHMQNGVYVDNVTGRPAFFGPHGEPAGANPGPGLVAFTMPDGRVAYYAQGNTQFADSSRGSASLSGMPNQVVDQLKQIARSYLIPLSDQAIQDWAQQIISGTADLNGFTSYAKEQAKSLFPGLAAAIDGGTTVAQYADTYKQIAAQTLELNPDSIDMLDPKFESALNQIDPKTGARVSMSLTDWRNRLRTDPQYGYSKTTQARDQAYGVAESLAQSLGAIA